ncbi:unnamed protein product [Staurois parvus]|uniref:Uncharacterized protein n=1 Tax=Staurois parvus TaxID=386267 RepID=A0ABN9B5M5_9NEOB|nr:unnamed protein product [Staurois parvus]
MTAGTGSTQASGHLACQRAPRHLARQWAPVSPVAIGSSGSTAGHLGHQASGHLARQRGTASSGKASGHPSHQVRQRALSHRIRSSGSTAASIQLA